MENVSKKCFVTTPGGIDPIQRSCREAVQALIGTDRKLLDVIYGLKSDQPFQYYQETGEVLSEVGIALGKLNTLHRLAVGTHLLLGTESKAYPHGNTKGVKPDKTLFGYWSDQLDKCRRTLEDWRDAAKRCREQNRNPQEFADLKYTKVRQILGMPPKTKKAKQTETPDEHEALALELNYPHDCTGAQNLVERVLLKPSKAKHSTGSASRTGKSTGRSRARRTADEPRVLTKLRDRIAALGPRDAILLPGLVLDEMRRQLISDCERVIKRTETADQCRRVLADLTQLKRKASTKLSRVRSRSR